MYRDKAQGGDLVSFLRCQKKKRKRYGSGQERRGTLNGRVCISQRERPHKNECLTLTFDNGKEFAEHVRIAKTLKAKVYFDRPYHSWERGLNENTNGLLRQYFPKSTNLLTVSACEVDEAVYQLNHRPRKCLGYRTPHEAFYGLDISPITLPTDALCS